MLDVVEEENNEVFEFITFSAGGQGFCLEITKIREIRRWTQVTVLPHTPSEVLGVMNLRGAVIPIYDLSAWFGLGKTEIGDRSVIIVAAVADNIFGLLVDGVSEILSARKSEIQETSSIQGDVARGSLIGMLTVGDNMVRVVRAEAISSANAET